MSNLEKEKSEEINHGLRLLANSALIVLITFIVAKVFGYLYRIIIARYFGPEVYGLYTLSIIVASWLVVLSSFGFSEGILRYASFYRGKNEIQKIRFLFRFSTKILIYSTITLSLLAFLFSNFIAVSIFHNQGLVIFIKFFSLITLFWAFSSYFLSIMRAFEKIKEVSIIESVIQTIIKVVSLLFFIFIGLNTYSIVFSFFLGILSTLLLTFFYFKYKLELNPFLEHGIASNEKNNVIGSFISYSWPMLFLGFFSSFFYWTGSFMIGYFKSVVEVGLYNVIVPIAILLSITPEVFLQLFFPLVTKQYSIKNFEFIKKISKQIGKWVFMVNLPLFFLIVLFPEIIIKILFGQNYLIAANSLRFLAFGTLFSSVFLISNNLLSMAGGSKTIFYDVIFVSLFNVPLNILLIQKKFIFGMDNSLGIIGAAIATSISLLILNLLFLVQARRYASVTPLKKEMFKIFLASILSLSMITLLKGLFETTYLSFIFLSLLFILIYLILLFLLNAFNEEDQMIIDNIKNKFVSFNFKPFPRGLDSKGD